MSPRPKRVPVAANRAFRRAERGECSVGWLVAKRAIRRAFAIVEKQAG
jgi:hypothetical protein